jgi:hypothetical protein
MSLLVFSHILSFLLQTTGLERLLVIWELQVRQATMLFIFSRMTGEQSKLMIWTSRSHDCMQTWRVVERKCHS